MHGANTEVGSDVIVNAHRLRRKHLEERDNLVQAIRQGISPRRR